MRRAKTATIHLWGLWGLLAVGCLGLSVPASAEEGGSLSGSSSAGIPSMVLSAGVGLSYYNGDFAHLYNSGSLGYTMGATVMSQVTDAPLYVGVDFGLNFWGFNAEPIANADHSRSAVGIQVLPAGMYRFALDAVPKLTPYFGFAVGPHFYILRDRVVNPSTNQVNTNSETHVYLELLAKPGAEYHFTDNVAVSFEPEFGLLNFDFIFLPHASLTLTL